MAYLEDGGEAIAVTADCDPEKINILLIGDSIRCGYCEIVCDELKDIANVFYPEENCRNSQYIVTKLNAWVKEWPVNKMDIVHFNCGHWDVAHWNGDEEPLTSPEEYGRNIRLIIRQLRKIFPEAKLAFATTSAMNPNGAVGVNPRSNQEIELYNDIGVKAAVEEGLEIDDIYKVTKAYGEETFRDYAHLTPGGFRQLGCEVAAFLRKMI